MKLLSVNLHLDSLVVDEIRINSCGTVHLLGWRRDCTGLDSLALAVNGTIEAPFQWHSHLRPDVPLKETVLAAPGFCLEYFPSPVLVERLDIFWREKNVYTASGVQIRCERPDYARLRTSRKVLGRDEIYGSGPPVPSANPEVLAFARTLPEPILDFGCGIGALVSELRASGVDASGLELDRPAISGALSPSTVPHVKLYDGKFPSPYPDQSFGSVVCSEVLEHIADYRGALEEIRRLARSTALFTVPDMSAIPILHKHNVVPWHLLESTHVNFFTQRNLEILLQEFFEHVEFARLGPSEINGTRYWVNLVAMCRTPRR